MKLFSGTKRKRDSLGRQVGPLSVAREVLAKIDPFQIFSCLPKNDPEALIPVLTDMANIVNEAFQKEKEISVANGWKLDMAALQRYVHICGRMTVSYFCISCRNTENNILYFARLDIS